jgi:hypothetical protein
MTGKPSEAIAAKIAAFAREYVSKGRAGALTQAEERDVQFLDACVTAIVDEAVRDAILLTAEVFRRSP